MGIALRADFMTMICLTDFETPLVDYQERTTGTRRLGKRMTPQRRLENFRCGRRRAPPGLVLVTMPCTPAVVSPTDDLDAELTLFRAHGVRFEVRT